MAKADLKIDWATHEAAKYACVNWHYSGCLPVGKLVKVGVWECGKFIGVVLFGRGASPNLGKPYALPQSECVELVRVALTSHESRVSRIVSIAMMFLRQSNQNLRLIVSFADQSQGHYGGIYQAGNWVYSGVGTAKPRLVMPDGSTRHNRLYQGRSKRPIPVGAKWSEATGKHRYLMPLDKEMAEQIKPLSKPYPKREKQAMASFPEAQRQGSTDLHAPVLESSGEGFSPLLADAS
jgi:hypothetical protein